MVAWSPYIFVNVLLNSNVMLYFEETNDFLKKNCACHLLSCNLLQLRAMWCECSANNLRHCLIKMVSS